MTCIGRAALYLGPTLAALAIAPAFVRADGGAPVRIRDVRVGEHAGFERLVVELDSAAEVVWENGPEQGEESFYIAAAPAQASRVIVTALPRVGTVSVTAMKGGAHVAIEPRARRVRAYMLTDPPRLVVDFAPLAQGDFKAPAGSRALEPARTIGPLVVEPEPMPEPMPEPEPAPPVESKAEPEAPTLETPPPLTPPSEPEPELAAEPTAAPELAPAAEPTAPPAPEIATPPAPEIVTTPAAEISPPPTAEVTTPPAPAPVTHSPDEAFPYGLALAGLVGLALAIAAAVAFVRGRAARTEEEISEFRPDDDLPSASRSDEITRAEILAAGDTEGLLAKRLDEEVRARFELEQRFAHANEELKVLRDRLHRLERRRESSS